MVVNRFPIVNYFLPFIYGLRRLNGLHAAMLARRQRAASFIGIGLETPEAQRLRIK